MAVSLIYPSWLPGDQRYSGLGVRHQATAARQLPREIDSLRPSLREAALGVPRSGQRRIYIVLIVTLQFIHRLERYTRFRAKKT